MSKYDNHNTSHLPLIESVIIIAIFAIVSVFIMQLYVAADRLQGKSVNISKATILAENTVEKIKSGELGLEVELSEILILDSVKPGDVIYRPGYLFYDKDWNLIAMDTGDSPKIPEAAVPDGAMFFMTYAVDDVQKDDSGCYETFTVTVSDIGVMTGAKGEQLVSIGAGRYVPCD